MDTTTYFVSGAAMDLAKVLTLVAVIIAASVGMSCLE